MRIVALTLYGKNVLGYGPFEIYRSWAMTAAEAGHFVEFIIPKNKVRGFNYDIERLKNYLSHERIRLLPVEMLKGGLNQWAAVPLELYDLLHLTRTEIYYDAIVSNWIASHPVLKRALMRKLPRNMIDIPLFGYSTNALDTGMSPMHDQEIWATCAGMITDYVGFMTESHRQRWMKYAAKVLAPSMIAKIKKRSVLAAAGGLDPEWIDSLEPIEEKGITIGYGGQLSSTGKGFPEMLKICAAVCPLTKAHAVFTTGDSVDKAALESKFPFANFHGSVGREEYIRRAKGWDVGICLSKRESAGTGYREMMFAGVVLAFLDGPFAREVTPNGYPYICKDISSLRTMVAYMVRNIDEVRKWRGPVRDHLSKIGDYRTENMKLVDWVVATTDEHYKPQQLSDTSSLSKVVKRAADSLKTPFTFSDFCKRLQQYTSSDYARPGSFIGPYYLRFVLLGVGYDDLCDGPEPKFVRRGR